MSDFPILDDLSSDMRCGIFTNSQGDLILVHDNDLSGVVDYVEYEPNGKTFCLVYESGKSQSLGIELNEKVKGHLLHGSEVILMQFKDKNLKPTQKVMFLIRDY